MGDNICSLDDSDSKIDSDFHKFKISAPGKVILFGEHSVVYGKTAVVSSLNLRTHLSFQEIEEDSIELSFEDIELNYFLNCKEIREFLTKPLPTSPEFNVENPSKLDHETHLKNVDIFLRNIDGKFENCPEDQRNSVTVFTYLFTSIFGSTRVNWRPFRIRVKSQLTLGAGTGSSASFTVCLTACLLNYLKLRRNENTIRENVEIQFEERELELISDWSFNGEKIYHGNPSGVDNFICTFGHVYEFKKGMKPVICNKQALNLIMINTKVARNTKNLVEKVAKFKRKHPIICENILSAMDEISKTALEHLRSGSAEIYAELSELSEMNQNLLTFLGVSHSTLDEIMVILKSYGLRGKLTGAGGGGHAICFVNCNEFEGGKLVEVLEDLKRSDYSATVTNVGLEGVRVDPF